MIIVDKILHIFGSGKHKNAHERLHQEEPRLAATNFGNEKRVDDGRPQKFERKRVESKTERALVRKRRFRTCQ